MQKDTRTTAYGRIQKDIREVNDKQNPDAPPIFALPVGDALDHIDALIIGPPDTPYSFGFFRFDMQFPATYPNTPPKVLITTTNGGRSRFNPNLYAGGKVCLSILGTWSGESEDEWRSSYSINYILSAIQSLIMTAKPYHNEPGYEEGGEHGNPDEVSGYSDKITHEVLRIAVCGMVEDAILGRNEPWNEVIKHQFLLWFDTYLSRAEHELSRGLEGQEFPQLPFEYDGNTAAGKYNYTNIITRLKDLKSRIERETEEWKEKGKIFTKKETGWKYYQLMEEAEKFKSGKVTLEGVSAAPVEDDNLYHWQASIFGPDGSPWEGGFYNVDIIFSEEEAPPRVRFLTEVFHPHVTSDGIPFYMITQTRRDLVATILNAIIKLLKANPNPSPATWANSQAAKMYFSNDEDVKKEYRKRVARLVRKSVEGDE
jgi:ubiquitin-conjugating enzyme E2 Z